MGSCAFVRRFNDVWLAATYPSRLKLKKLGDRFVLDKVRLAGRSATMRF